tara:strand:+ start:573 stop:695 length:123 start_codon:yes stop_codon:yes gene_type:complete
MFWASKKAGWKGVRPAEAGLLRFCAEGLRETIFVEEAQNV